MVAEIRRIASGLRPMCSRMQSTRVPPPAGAYLEFDLVGIEWINSDKRRAEFLAELVRRGHQDRLLVAQDMPARPRLKTNGGHGYQYLIDDFLPMLRAEGVEAARFRGFRAFWCRCGGHVTRSPRAA